VRCDTLRIRFIGEQPVLEGGGVEDKRCKTEYSIGSGDNFYTFINCKAAFVSSKYNIS
jgi:hypothetical protein